MNVHTSNRMLSIIREKDERTKEHLLTDLHNRIVFGGDSPLNDNELEELFNILYAKKESRTILIMLWRFACESKFHPKLEQYARKIVEKSEKTASSLRLGHFEDRSIQQTYRHYAVSYLHRHNSVYFVRNLQKIMQDQDPYIVYEVACEIGKSSLAQKITMLIDLYDKVETHDLHDLLDYEISQGGNEEHLEMLRNKMKQSRKKHIYETIISVLEATLRKQK